MKKYLRIAEDECSGKTDTMDYVKCRATKMEKEQGTPADKAFPTAWSIACKYKRDQLSDADEHCQKKPNEYFKAKKANGDSMNIPKRYLASNVEAELEMTAGHTPESFKKMLKDNPELAKEWEKQIKENEGVVTSKKSSDMTAEEAEYTEMMAGHTPESFKKMYDSMSESDKKKWEANKDKYGDKFKKAHDKTARLMKRQIKILEKYVASAYDVPFFFDDLPSNVIAQLRRVKDQETLHTDVERWLGDWKMEQRMNSRWANSPYLTRSAKENPMNKTAKMALRTLTANWGLTAYEAEDMLAEEEMAEYLAEMEALAFEEMMADELEAGGNAGFDKYKQKGKPGWFKPNYTNEDRGGNGAGKDGDKNYLYHDYGSAPKGKAYQEWYSKNKLWNEENRPSKEKPRKVCPDMAGGKAKC